MKHYSTHPAGNSVRQRCSAHIVAASMRTNILWPIFASATVWLRSGNEKVPHHAHGYLCKLRLSS